MRKQQRDADHHFRCDYKLGSVGMRLALILAIAFACTLAYVQMLSKQCITQERCKGKDCPDDGVSSVLSFAPAPNSSLPPASGASLGNIVFGIAATARLWNKRQNYVKLWWRPNEMRGFVWLDQPVDNWSSSLPPFRLSEDTTKFRYTHRGGRKAAIRISRIVSETFRVGLPDVEWFVMGDDDTVFVPENLVKVLSKYDSRKFYYIGASSESHHQNLMFSYNMAYGGGGFAISYSLAKALAQGHDECLQRYPYLYGSDDRMKACMAELGIPLTREAGFHQFDIHGDVSGMLAAHPPVPFISIHHLDVIKPIFPGMNQVQALRHLRRAVDIDPAGIFQQAMCYHKKLKWSVSVSWGYVVQLRKGIISPRDLEIPLRTFASWNRKYDSDAYSFATRAAPKNPCERPLSLYMETVAYGDADGISLSNYTQQPGSRLSECRSNGTSPEDMLVISVIKERVDEAWFEAPRRQCCRILQVEKSSMLLLVRNCKENELIG